MRFRGQLRGMQGLAIVVRRRQLHGGLMVRQRHAGWQVHLYAVVDVLLFDQAARCCCRRSEVTAESSCQALSGCEDICMPTAVE